MIKRILLVEDEALICETLEDLLQPSGYFIKSAPEGSKAIEILKLYRPHLIISDIMMPGMDGIKLLKEIKSNPDWNDIPVILLTAKKEIEDRIAGLETGADAYIAKPFNIRELLLTARNLLELKHNIVNGSFLHQQEVNEATEGTTFIKKLSAFLNANFAEQNLSLSVLAAYFDLSASGFKKKLKRTTGKSVRELVGQFRLTKAREQLTSQKFNVSEVALNTGFRSTAHFSDAFKKHFGVSPSTFLK